MNEKLRRWRQALTAVAFALAAVLAALAEEEQQAAGDCASSQPFAGETITTAAKPVAR